MFCKSACLAGLTFLFALNPLRYIDLVEVYEGNAASLGCVAGRWAAAFTALQLTEDIYTITSSNWRRGSFLRG